MKKRINNHQRSTIKKVMNYIRRYWGYLGMSIVLAAVTVALTLYLPVLTGRAVDLIIEKGVVDFAGILAILKRMAVIILLTAAAQWIMNACNNKITYHIIRDIRKEAFEKIERLPLKYIDGHSYGEIVSRMIADVDQFADGLLMGLTQLFSGVLTILGTLLFMLSENVPITLVVVCITPLSLVVASFLAKRSYGYFQSQSTVRGEKTALVNEMIEGQKVVKVFNHQQADMAAFAARNEKLREAGTGAQSYAATLIPAVVSIGYLNYAVIAVLGGLMVMKGWTALGSLASYLVFVRQTTLPINQFTQQGNFLLAALAGAERIFTVMEEKPEIAEGTGELVSVRENSDGTLTECAGSTGRWAWCDRRRPDVPLEPLHGDVRFHDVSFGYTPDRMILQNLSLYAKPGQKIAFVGSTGAGKTTITNLINRFYDITSGTITYDGIDVRKIRKSDLRRSLGVVLQDTHLFTGTVADNIRFGKLDATDEEIIAAAKIANAHSFIERLPQGYNTMVSGDGANLSQGQRQLLAIARAAVADPPVLILDEATSSIDTRTEALIEKGMDRLMEGRTVFVIAHRLSTVRNSNAIIVLEHGGIVERGSHDELLAQKGEYYQLYNGMFELA